MLNSFTGAHAPANHYFHEDPRATRLASEARKLVAATRNYVGSRRDLVPLGDDPLVAQLVSSAGFKPVDAHVTRVGAKGRLVTVICVPTRIWHDDERRERLLEVKREARVLRTSCLLVPQRSVKAPVRSAVARILARTRNTYYSSRQRHAVQEHLATTRISTIGETAAVVHDHDDAVGAVLAMVTAGLVEIDRTAPIAADTWIAASPWMAGLERDGGRA